MGIEVHEAGSREDMLVLHRLVMATRRRLGLPGFPAALFESMWTHLAAEQRRVFIASYHGKPIAAVGGLVLKDRFYWEFSGALPKEEANYASPLVLWECIRWACISGIKQFSLGRTDASNEGLLRYKRHWGPEEEELVVWERSANPKKSIASGQGQEFRSHPLVRWSLRYAPRPLYEAAGRLFYSNWG
jgi:hypothetical protein